MNTQRKTLLIVVAILLAILTYLLYSTSKKGKDFQAWLGSLYDATVQTAVALVLFFVVGIILIEVLELPVLVAVAAVIALSYLAYKAAGWLSSLWDSITGSSSSPAAAGSSVGTYDPSQPITPLNSPPGTVFNADGSYTLPSGQTGQTGQTGEDDD